MEAARWDMTRNNLILLGIITIRNSHAVFLMYLVSFTYSNDVLLCKFLGGVNMDSNRSLRGSKTTAAKVTKATTSWNVFL